MKASIFYSWQSSLPSSRYFIEKCIKKSINILNKKRGFIAILDRDTKNESGSPNIIDTVFKKIDRSKFFICDLSLLGDTPNPNVLIELGYAIKVLGWNKIICLFDKQTGNVEMLPFDINHNRITIFDSTQHDDLKRITNIINLNIDNLLKNGKLFNPIEDHLKKKIDYIVMQIIRNLVNILRFEQETNYSTYLCELNEYDIKDIAKALEESTTLGFYYRFDYEYYQETLETILDKLLSCDYFLNSWREAIINFIDWIDMWTHTVEAHSAPDLLKEISSTDYVVKNMYDTNPQNPKYSAILMSHIKEDKYRVIQGGFIRNLSLSNKKVTINPQYALAVARRIKELLYNIDFWMSESGDEFILDPHYYVIN